jgi:CO/xanthine dehydrogenase FAD-binding subunit
MASIPAGVAAVHDDSVIERPIDVGRVEIAAGRAYLRGKRGVRALDLLVQRVVRPISLSAALAALAEHPEARPVAGGTDLVVQLRDGRQRVGTLVDLSAAGMDGIVERSGGLVIGATTTMAAIAAHPLVQARHPALAAAARTVGAWPIQCRATLGGNLANASPAADTAPALLVADARVRIAARNAVRRLPLDEFFLGPGRTALGRFDLIAAVELPTPRPEAVERFFKVGPRQEQIIAVVTLAGRLVVEDGVVSSARIALGAVAPTPVRARRTEATLEGRRPGRELVDEAVRALQTEITPIDDVRAPARYRRVAAAVLLSRLLESCRG